MTEMQVFSNPVTGGGFRALEKDGEIWFVATDVCQALGHSNTSMALDRLDEDEKMTLSLTEGRAGQRGGAQMINIINEPGLYNLVLGSRKPEAKAFKRWVTHEVLPAIRRTGRYSTDPERGDMTLSEAVRSLRDCAPEVRLCIHKLLLDMGFDLPAMEPTRLSPSHYTPLDKARFADWFRGCYESQGMTYQDVADALGTNKVNVYRWGHGVSRPRAPYMRTITEYFGPCPENDE